MAAKCLRVVILDGARVPFSDPSTRGYGCTWYGADSCAGREEIILGRHGRNHTKLDVDTGLTTDDETKRSEQSFFH
jgi:hypothetical protein